eukprot:361432-Chlamydomonas_euryale.AAC.15
MLFALDRAVSNCVNSRRYRFSHPYSTQVSTNDVNEYKSIKVLVRKVISDLERDWGQAEWALVYVRPANVDAQVRPVHVSREGKQVGTGKLCECMLLQCVAVKITKCLPSLIILLGCLAFLGLRRSTCHAAAALIGLP